jgi:hypothetical protein
VHAGDLRGTPVAALLLPVRLALNQFFWYVWS